MSADTEHRRRIEAALARMDSRQREIFLAVRIDGLSYAEIARRTGLSVRQVERAFAASLLVLFAARDAPPARSSRSSLRGRLAAWLRR